MIGSLLPRTTRASTALLRSMRLALPVSIALASDSLSAQSLTARDSMLVGRVLLAEDRRDAADPVLREAAAHSDVRLRTLAQRAVGRISDPKFVRRDSLPALPAAPLWPEPAWRLRFRGLTAKRDDCNALRTAVADSAWPVRFRAAQVVRASCSSDMALRDVFVGWLRALPRDASRRTSGAVSWQAAAQGLLALARVWPADGKAAVVGAAANPQWQMRQYAARAAALVSDTVTLRRLAADRDDNVAETAIEALAKLTAHADDALYVAAIERRGAQVVRAAATALKGSPRADVAAAAMRVFERFVARANASERDARVALLAAAGRPASEDKPPMPAVVLPADAVALALGADVRLRVTMSKTSGGGTFDVKLRGDNAPLMAARILALVKQRYYNGLTWHRVEHDFVIQGGSPGANEYVGFAEFLRDELGVVSHRRGTLGMSTRGHDTGDAQWFVNLRDNARLDPDYTVWAEVVAGIDVVDGVLEGDTIERIEVLAGGR
ncbi:MAG: peptidylprolyl isomerase [Gemmatimonadaceae bacterium]